MNPEDLRVLVHDLRAGPGFARKHDIGAVVGALAHALPGGVAGLAQALPVGDDCAAIADGDGYLLLAIEGIVEEVVNRRPWFAGYWSVMVNISDVAAMGGRPIAVVDALWSRGMEPAATVLQGMAEASLRYGVPIVGGHTNNRSERGQLAVAIVGRARRLLSSFAARAGDALVMAVDLRGAYEGDEPYWDASVRAPAERLRGDLEILPRLAEAGLCDAAKDISMAGALGTALMLLECSQVGATIDLEAIPRPPGVPLLRWLQTFPSYGFLLSVRPPCVAAVLAQFAARAIAGACVGTVTNAGDVRLRHGEANFTLWDRAAGAFMAPR